MKHQIISYGIVSIGGQTFHNDNDVRVILHGQGNEPRGRQARMACPQERAQGKYLK